MQEWFSDAAIWIGGVILSVFAWLGKREITRIDAHEKELQRLGGSLCTHEDIAAAERRIRESINEGWHHVAERMGDIKATADKAHDRIDGMQKR